MTRAGFTVIEMLAVLVLASVLYALLFINYDARWQPVAFASSTVQARLWSDAAEIERRRGALRSGTADAGVALRRSDVAPARTLFGGAYRITATTHTAVVSFDVPFEAHGGGLFTADHEAGGTVRVMPTVLAPTAPMQEKVLLYREAIR